MSSDERKSKDEEQLEKIMNNVKKAMEIINENKDKKIKEKGVEE